MFIVVSQPAGDQPYMAFSRQEDALSFAGGQVQAGADVAAIYEVPGIDDVAKAVAALKRGEGLFVTASARPATGAQIQDYELFTLLGSP